MKRFAGRRGSAGRLGVVAVALTAMTALAACGSSSNGPGSTGSAAAPSAASSTAWDKITSDASTEGALTIYTSMGQMSSEPNLYAAFQKAYPKIKITLNFQATSDLINRLDQEMAANVKGADVVMHASPGWFSDNVGNFASLQLSPENQTAGWEKMLGGKSYATWWGFQYVLGYRTTATKPPADLQELLNSNPHAKIGIVDPKVAQAIANVYQTLIKTYGAGIMTQLSKAQFTVFSSNSTLAAAMAAGSVDYAYPDQVNTEKPLIAKGAPVADLITTKAQAGASYNVAVLKNAPHPNAAQAWANFVMSPAGQAAIAQDNAPAATAPLNPSGAIPWGTVSFLNPADWTNDLWNAWIAKNFTPNFK